MWLARFGAKPVWSDVSYEFVLVWFFFSSPGQLKLQLPLLYSLYSTLWKQGSATHQLKVYSFNFSPDLNLKPLHWWLDGCAFWRTDVRFDAFRRRVLRHSNLNACVSSLHAEAARYWHTLADLCLWEVDLIDQFFYSFILCLHYLIINCNFGHFCKFLPLAFLFSFRLFAALLTKQTHAHTK